MAASLLSSRGPVSVMSWRRSRGQVVASELGHIRPRFLPDKADWHPFLSLALLIAAVAARQFNAGQVGEVELDDGFERLGGTAAL